MKPTVAVALIHWNSGELTRACVESLMAGTRVPDRIMILDNGSTDPASRELDRLPGPVTVLRSASNVGFAAAANSLIEAMLRERHDYLWILNNDTTVELDALAILVDAMERHVEWAVCSAKILLASSAEDLWYGGGELDLHSLRARHRVEKSAQDQVSTVRFISGCCMFARRSAFADVGGFDVSFFAYCEDTDWCLRAVRGGLVLGYVPTARIHHAVSASVRRSTLGRSRGTASPFQQYLTIRSRGLLIRKHAASRVARIRMQAGHGLVTLKLVMGQLILGRFEKIGAVIRGFVAGCTDALDAPLSQDTVRELTGIGK